MATYSINDAGDPRKYYIQVPNLIDDYGLSVYAFRLYVHLKRVAGEDGLCYQSTRTLATACKMSVGSVSNAKDELAAAGLIKVKTITGGHGEFDRHEVTIVDVWEQNMRKYACSPDEQERITTRTGACYDVNRSVSPHEPKNNPIKNNSNKNGDKSPDLTPGQSFFLSAFSAKRFKNDTQKDTVAALEATHGLDALKDAVEWAAKKGMNLGAAVVSVESALKRRAGSNGNPSPAPIKITPGQER